MQREEMDGEYGIGRFGGSMRVESVQALAARQREEIPARYIRPEMEDEQLLLAGDNEAIPFIDFSKLVDPHFSEEEAAKLHLACAEWGFFQLINHGVPEEIINKLKNYLEEFFQLPLEEKEKVAQLPGEVEGYGNAFVQSEEQKLDWGDMLYLTVLPPHLRLMQLWPSNPPSFSETLSNYSIEVKRVANYLLSVMSKNLGLEQENLYDIFKDGMQSMRMNYYPPCLNPEKVLGLSPHSDAVGLTILLQVNEMKGLQIRRNGGWLAIEPLPGAFVVNIGDIIEILCNGKYKSIEHRAVVSNEKERISVAAFHTLNFGDIVGPISELAEEGKPCYRSLDFQDYMKQFFASKLDGKSLLDRMKLT
ncbi:hypothetical protein KFK09_028827 [Dendrobium nobile]|uniref:Fe2OG dioxygenase domain-containing protein n=1 Tax=Dendrobium nobile TaxID=94219 RepID=A0A8T3A3R5_DENNO|nr:hypothetical protein KFK09_028827 [Dendrobium nobile]